MRIKIKKKIYKNKCLGIGDWEWGLGPIPNPHIFKIKYVYNLN